jgi:hypothetical protein
MDVVVCWQHASESASSPPMAAPAGLPAGSGALRDQVRGKDLEVAATA